MRNNNRNSRYKSKVNPEDDGLNRTFFGAPTIGGAILVIIIIGYIIYSMFFN